MSAVSALRSGQQVPAGCGMVVADLDRRFYAGAVDRMIAWGLDLLVVVLAHHYLVARGRAPLGVLVIVTTVVAVGSAFATLLGATGRRPGVPSWGSGSSG